MTVLGKILTVLILVLALAQAALFVVFHVTQTNWVKEYNKRTQELVVAQTEADTYRRERDQSINDAGEQVKKIQADLDVRTNERDQARANSDALQMQLDAEKQKVIKGDASVASGVTDAQRREDEVKRLEETVKTNNDKIDTLVTDNNKLRDRAVAAEIEARSFKDRNGLLMAKLEEMSKDLVKAKTTGTTGGGAVPSKNPPLENIEGLVTKTDASSGLLTLSIGSDAGLVKNNTLEVFRLNPARYLGTVRVISVTPHEAVAQPVSRPLGPIQQGDRVASRILGS